MVGPPTPEPPVSTSCSGYTSWHPSSSCIKLRDDWIAHCFYFSLFVLEFIYLSKLIGIKPFNCLSTFLSNLLFFIFIDFIFEIFILNSCFHIETVRFKPIFSRDSLFLFLIIRFEFLGVSDHLFDFFLGESSLIISDCDLVLFSSTLVAGRDVKNPIGINIESDFNLRHTPWCRRNACQVKFPKKVVVLGHSALTFIDLNGYSWLVITVSCEGLSLLGWDSCVPLDKGCHHTSSCLNAHRQWSHIKQQEVRNSLTCVTREDCSLDCSSISHCFIRVDGLV